MEEQGITPLDRLRTSDNFNENSPAYLRAREKFTARRDNMLYGKGFHEREYASMMKDLSGPEQAALEIEFGQTPEMRNFFSEAKQARENYDIKGGPIDWLNDGITKFSDFASMDREDDGMFEKTVRGAANIPFWTAEGIQTAGQGVHDLFTDEDKDLNRGSTFNNIVRGSGALFGGGGAAKLVQGSGKLFSGGAKALFPGTANALGKGKDVAKNLLTRPSGKQAAKAPAGANPNTVNQTLNGNKMSINTGPAAAAPKGAGGLGHPGSMPGTKTLSNPAGAATTKGATSTAGKGATSAAGKGGDAAAKTGLTAKAIALAKANPKTAAAAGLIGTAGVASMFDDDPAARLDPNEKKEGDGGGAGAGAGDGATTLGLGSGMNPGEANPTGERNAANQRDFMKPRLGGSGSSMMDLGAARQRAFADKQEDIRQDKLEGNFDPTFSQDPNYFLKQRYEATGGRGAGDWDLLTPEEKSKMAGNYRQNSYYDSSSDAGKAADAKLKESGFQAPMADPQSQAEGQAMAEQNRLQELDEAVERQEMGLNDAYGVAADPENYQGDVKAVSKEEFTDKSGMFTPGTGIIGDDNTGRTTLETADAFKRSGGRDSAEDFLLGSQQQGPILPQGQKTFGPQQNMPRPMSEPGVEQQGPVGYPTTGYSQADPLLDPNVGDIQNQPRPRVGGVENGASLMAQLDNIGPGSGKAPVETAPGQYTPASTTTTMTEPATNPFDPQNMDAPWMNRPAQYETTENPASYQAPEYEGSGKGMYTDQFGQESELSKGTVRMSADDQEYGKNFTSNDDALGYINRGGRPSMDEPAPAPAPGPTTDPNAIMGPENTTRTPWEIPVAVGVLALMKKFGIPRAAAEKMYKATPIARPTLNAGNPKLAHDATRGLKKYDPTLLGNRATPQLTNNRATAEQFRRAASAPGSAQAPSMAQRHAAQNAPRVNLSRSGVPNRDPRTGQIIPTEQMRGEAIRRQQLALGNNL